MASRAADAPMLLYPAIDLKAGKAVRLIKGDFNRSTVFNDVPEEQARAFCAAGCRWLHVVDLDGAVDGKSRNAQAVRAIIRACDIPIQLGGGIRDQAAVDYWLAAGVQRVVMGTAAVEDPQIVRTAAARHPGRIAVAIDARDGVVATRGWLHSSSRLAVDLAREFEDAGVAAIIHTDIGSDGAMCGPNLAAIMAMMEAVDLVVIASGGVSSRADLAALRRLRTASGRSLQGVIVGRALYDGAFNMSEALEILAGTRNTGRFVQGRLNAQDPHHPLP